ncbi:hypothetical protein [Agarivorans sp. QJM3NY_33]|uniref:hypothetical protein n=1 Tax=Agarivorans sp. QJM3NY_33 TaxID=3421432 RepID=UPI003D7E72FA
MYIVLHFSERGVKFTDTSNQSLLIMVVGQASVKNSSWIYFLGSDLPLHYSMKEDKTLLLLQGGYHSQIKTSLEIVQMVNQAEPGW